MPVVIEEPASIDNRETHNPLGARLEAQNVAFGCSLALGFARLTNMQVQDVSVRLVVGMVEGQRPDLDLHGFVGEEMSRQPTCPSSPTEETLVRNSRR